MLTKRERTCGVMANSGIWSPLKYVTKYGDILIEAVIPISVLDKVTKTIPRAILGLIKYPTAENRFKLRLKGIVVKYTPAEKQFDSERLYYAA